MSAIGEHGLFVALLGGGDLQLRKISFINKERAIEVDFGDDGIGLPEDLGPFDLVLDLLLVVGNHLGGRGHEKGRHQGRHQESEKSPVTGKLSHLGSFTSRSILIFFIINSGFWAVNKLIFNDLTASGLLFNIKVSCPDDLVARGRRRFEMNKKETIIRMSKDAGITALQAAKAFSSLIEGVKNTLKNGGKVTFSGFGSFEVKERKARKGRNPKTGSRSRHPAQEQDQVQPEQKPQEFPLIRPLRPVDKRGQIR